MGGLILAAGTDAGHPFAERRRLHNGSGGWHRRDGGHDYGLPRSQPASFARGAVLTAASTGAVRMPSR